MAWSPVGNPVTKKITPSLAREFAEMPTIKHDRPLSPKRMEIYRKVYDNNMFRGPDWAKVLCKENGNTYRVNGKHTSTLFSQLDNEFGVKATIHTYEADTFEDVVRLYGTFDDKAQSRSSGDINTAFSSCVPEIADYPRKLINDVISGICYSEHYDNARYMRPTAKAEKILQPDNVKFATWLKENLYDGGAPRNHIWRSPVVAAIYATYNKCQRDANDFWTRVRDETGTSPDMPCRQLAKFLATTDMINTVWQSPEFYYRSISAWNAFRQNNDKFSSTYAKNRKLPRVL